MKLSNDEMLARLRKVLDLGGNCYSVADIRAALRTGAMAAFVNEDPSGCILADICHYPQKRVLNVVAGFGTMKGIAALFPQLRAHAEECGCETIYMRGRHGWARVLPKFGSGPLGRLSELRFDLRK